MYSAAIDGTRTFLLLLQLFTARCCAERCIAICRGKSSVCPSVRPSVTLMNCDHISWNSSKIILTLVSLGRSLFAINPNMTGLHSATLVIDRRTDSDGYLPDILDSLN